MNRKDILNGNYSVDILGNVYSNNWNRTGKVKKLKPAKDKKGYLRVGLTINSQNKTFKVHRLIAKAYLDNKENKPCVNHINGVKNDNRLCNLEWCTYKENTKHAIDNNLFYFNSSEESKNKNPKKGSLNGQSKLKEQEVLEIRSKYKPKIYTRKMLSEEYKVTISCIKDVLSRKSWKHI